MNFILQPINLLFLAAALISGSMLFWASFARRSGAHSLSTLEATQLMNSRNALVIDVRESSEFAQGTVTGARNIPLAKIKERRSEIARYKTRPVIVVCGAGQRSAKAVTTLGNAGFTEVYNLAGGLKAWRAAGMPLMRVSQKEGSSNAVKKEKA